MTAHGRTDNSNRMFRRLLDALCSRFPKLSAPVSWVRNHRKMLIMLFIVGFHLLGALTSIHAILGVRTAQGAIAWAVSLNTVPYVAVPAYWVFGRSNFEGYLMLRREQRRANRQGTGDHA